MKSIAEDKIRPCCPVGESHCAIIEELMQLRELARTDPLTGLFNNRHFREALAQEMERTQRQEQPTSLMFIDIDFFKKVNDQHGHEVGNLALKHLSKLLTNNLRRLDIAARYGGEEFVVILPGTDLYTGKFVAERIRALIEANPLRLEDGQLTLTVSIGIDTFRVGDTDSTDAFIARTDALLYKAKSGGRNRVVQGLADMSTEAKINADEKAALSDLFNK